MLRSVSSRRYTTQVWPMSWAPTTLLQKWALAIETHFPARNSVLHLARSGHVAQNVLLRHLATGHQRKQFSSSTITAGGVELKFSREVDNALQQGRPIVALESTIISHGMPYPQNVETAREVENIVRQHGAVPATICVLGGELRVGVNDEELERLGKLGLAVKKTSTRDLPLLLSSGGDGATTVSATMWVAKLAGIGVFVTGGIGGVHRGASDSGDVSADLTELSRTPVTVVCAGVKSILDIRKTLEYLETVGVSVLSYGSKAFPAFFSPDSGFAAQADVYTPQQVAHLVQKRNQLQLPGGTVVGVPIPVEAAAEAAGVEAAIQDALREAEAQQVEGQAVTPFLLKRIKEITGGASLAANIALVKNNAAVGASIAVELAQLNDAAAAAAAVARAQEQFTGAAPQDPAPTSRVVEDWIARSRHKAAIEQALAEGGFAAAVEGGAAGRIEEQGWGSWGAAPAESPPKQSKVTVVGGGWKGGLRSDVRGRGEASVLVVGGCVEDLQGASEGEYVPGTSNPGTVRSSYGGVGRNIAEGVARLGERVRLESVVGSDEAGMALIAHCAALPHLDASGVRVVKGQATARFLAVCSKEGDMVGAVADMKVMEQLGAGSEGWNLANLKMVVADGNPPLPALLSLAQAASRQQVPLFFEPTSVPKAKAAAKAGLLGHVTFTSPNAAELRAMVEGLGHSNAQELSVEQMVAVLLDVGVGVVIVTAGEQGVFFGTLDAASGRPAVVHFQPREVEADKIVSTTGAGDSFAAGFVTGTVRGAAMDEAVQLGLKAAAMTLQSEKAVSPHLESILHVTAHWQPSD